jgi:hypothetical protein
MAFGWSKFFPIRVWPKPAIAHLPRKLISFPLKMTRR